MARRERKRAIAPFSGKMNRDRMFFRCGELQYIFPNGSTYRGFGTTCPSHIALLPSSNHLFRWKVLILFFGNRSF
jgi:hypothetical protein